jgi:homoserine O-acetyltransferase/O-succinyltransferase
MNALLKHYIYNYKTESGTHYEKVSASFQVYGQEINTAPIVIINHALTGNSDVLSHDKGWWKELVGKAKLIDTNKYTVIAFNIPGNGYDGQLFDNYKDFTTKDIARIFFSTLQQQNIKQVYAIIGGSLGGGVTWEIASLYPTLAKYIIPIASDWKSSDWVIAHNAIQESILLNSSKPLEDARKMALLFYRNPKSFAKKFNRTKTADNSIFNIESWLNHHAKTIKNRFEPKAYLMMNHLLSSINIIPKGKTLQDALSDIKSTIIQISISSDLLFVPDEIKKTKLILDFLNIKNQYHEIKSIDGHDAFLIEHKQITDFLSPIFNT